jgi:RND family efflux transporter MFP subunit
MNNLSLMNMNHLFRHAGIFACVLFMAGSFESCTSAGGKKDKDQQTAKEKTSAETPVTTIVFPLKKGKLSSSLQVPGELIAYQQVDLYAKVNSFVKKLNVDVGSEVREGQLLAVMEAPEMNSQLAGAHSRLQSQEAIYMASKATYTRLYETSQTPGTVSQNDLDQALAKMNSDKAQLESARSAQKEIADTRDYLEIRAPFSGVISARNVNTGAYVGPAGKGSELPLFTLQQQKRLRLVISVPEAFTGYLNGKSEVSFTVKALPDQTFTARVKRMAGALDTRLRSERIEMDVYNDNKKLLPGMVAEVNLPLPSSGNSSFVIPKTALVNSTERLFVIKIVNGNAVWVDVKKGLETSDKVEVYGQLTEGDSIITTATDEIRNGAPVANVKLVQ